MIARPPRGPALACERQIRKKAWRLARQEQLPFHGAPKQATDDSVVKGRFFATPMALGTAACGSQDVHPVAKAIAECPAKQARVDQVGNEGGGKGGGMGAGRGGGGQTGGRSAPSR